MKKKHKNKKTGLYMSIGLVLVSVMYVFSEYTSNTQAATTTAVATVPSYTQVAAVSAKTAVVAKSTGAYTNGTYTGTAADAYYGTVQVRATIQGGKLANVQFLQYPSDRSTSRSINGRAMPALMSEAISAQSSNVSGVSGATFTSQAFKQSLFSALNQAQA